MDAEYEFLPELFLRAPYYSFARYDMDRLPEIMNDQVFRNAIWLASPGFYRQLERKNFDFNRLLEKEKNTLYKYYNRMCFRPTPFGSFASFTNLAWSSGATVHLENDEQVFLHLLPDQGVITQVNALADNRAGSTLVTTNPTLYRFGGEFRFVKSRQDSKGRYRFTVEAFKAEPFYQKLITLFKNGYYAVKQLREWILNDLKCTPEEAEGYLAFLLDEQILFGPSIGNIIYRKNENLLAADIPGLDDLWLKARKNPIRESGILTSLSERIMEWLPGTEIASDQLFYAALERPHQSGGPGEDDLEELKSGIAALQFLSIPGKPAALLQFITAFKARFDLEKVPLLQAMDPDAGINYGNLMDGVIANDMLKDLRFPLDANTGKSGEWTDIHKMLFSNWRERDRNRYVPLELRESDLLKLKKPGKVSFPPTMAMMFRKTENGLLIEYAGGATAAGLIGRFSMFNEQTLELAEQIAGMEQESHPGIVFADISQLSDQHVDNINRRKMIYPYEIPLNVYSSLDYGAQIRPDDLYLSVINDELILESKRLKKRVVPRLATAYNYYHNESAVFRMLCDLQYQGINTNITLDLEQFFPDLDFYPRVCIGHVILSAARWILDATVLGILLDENQPDYFRRIREFRRSYGLPQWICIGQGDQQLVFDLGSRDEAGFFLRCISGLKKLVIQEYLSPDRSIKAGSRPMAGQYIAFMKHEKRIYAIPTQTGFKRRPMVPRVFQLGSGWIYLKIYCTPESADLILLNTLSPFLIKNGSRIKRWFFIRYNENGYHLRIRLNAAEENIGHLLTAFKNQLNNRGHQQLIKELQGESYRRELERYGSDIIHLVEQYFEASSDLILKMLQESHKGQSDLTAFEAGCVVIFHLLGCFIGKLPLVKMFTGHMAEAFLLEFKANKELRIDLDTKYRAIKPRLTDLLENPVKKIFTKGLRVKFQRLMEQTKIVAAATGDQAVEQNGRMIADLIHMHLNRVFRSNPRQQELLVYYCLNKYVSSKIVRLGEGGYSGNS
jgi:thiopeptide-type bacteriocin biosynthesis protein